MTEMVRIYVEGPDGEGAHVFDADSEAGTYNSSLYGVVKPKVLVLLEGETHVYGQADQHRDVSGEYEVAFDAGVLKINGRGGKLIRAYGIAMWQQVYKFPSVD
ncbi:hypothetical protein [Arthrobacter roseus]|uniref:hypothetical protein n=1 Tax=Arthrobacter roseus TaxID=136274 RepID=UPI0019652046|nr:hypothetical protein [Arthrobacter roseus]MBM7847193.1 hypothetical protein [Arthrobacter roseus]